MRSTTWKTYAGVVSSRATTWAVGDAVDLGVIVPPDQIITIPTENRTLVVPAESRTLIVPAENRTLVVPAEDRTVTVPAERLTLVPA